MIRKILCMLLIISSFCGLGAQGLIYKLEQLVNPEMLPQYRPEVIRQFSSYDTTGGYDDGFSGKYSFIHMEGDKQILAEMTGPGVISRIYTPTPTEDITEFYFDGELTLRIRMPFSRLFTGNQFPFLNAVCDHEVGGYYCYLPMPCQKSCKMLYNGKMLFWQLHYRTYPEGTHIKTFSPDWDETEVAALNKTVGIWRKYGTNILDKSYKNFIIKTTEIRLNPGESMRVFNSRKGRRIIGIEIEGSDKLQKNDNRTILKAKWDNDNSWSLKAPLKDMFGYYFGKKGMRSLLAGSSGDISYLYYPMPFSHNALVEIELPGDDQTIWATVNLLVRVFYQERPRDENEGRFYAHWRRNIDLPTGEP